MADTESILQLGIEAARAGDKEEARNLFRLLTRETPEDPQAWLWLAGVAEDREEKRAALEQATRLDPSNELARQGLAALGGPSQAAAPPPAQSSADDFDFDFSTAPIAEDTPPPAKAPEPARTRELTPDEEFAMSLDSLGSLSNTYNEKAKESGGPVDFDIPDFGDDDLDLNAYMNRERVDISTIEVTPEEAKKPVRKQISKGGISDEAKARYKEKKPRAAGATASGGRLPLIAIALLGLLVVFGLWWFLLRDKGTVVAEATPTPDLSAGIDSTPIPTIDPALPTTDPATGGVSDPNATEPIPSDGGETGGEATQPPEEQPTQPPFSPPPDPALGSVQPNILPGNGSIPVVVDNWYFNYGGTSGIADGNAIGIQPQGRWVIVGALMADGTASERVLPGDLLVLKDAQGRVYRPNPDASEAFLNTYPGSYTINQKQPAPAFVNFSVPLLFDVAPDATDLVLFSPQDTNQGYYVRANAD